MNTAIGFKKYAPSPEIPPKKCPKLDFQTKPSKFFNKGTTLACFQDEGKVDLVMDIFTMWVRGATSSGATSLMT